MSSINQHIHIVGCSPRSGTTLMQEMMVSCFEIDSYCDHEQSIFKSPLIYKGILCTKHPREIAYMNCVLHHNSRVHVIYIVRDPRDVVVSKHKNYPERYYSNLRVWLEADRYAAQLNKNPRFFSVRYEDLVNDPDEVQRRIEQAMPFLKRLHPFSEFHLHAEISAASTLALGGVRPVDRFSIGRWRQHIDRVASQIALHGDISARLVDLGYEADNSWLMELPSYFDENESFISEKLTPSERLRLWWRLKRKCLNYFIKIRLSILVG